LAATLPAVVGKDLDKDKADKWAAQLAEAGAVIKIE
jgi:ribosomal protein L7/L12